MKEICLLYKGENIEKLSYKLGIDCSLKTSEDTVQNYKYVTIKDGESDVQIVRNYNPYFVTKNNTTNQLKLSGYEIVSNDNSQIIFYKPSGVKYSVKPLETLKEIANKFGVTEEYIMSLNYLNTNKLFVGQILII